MLTKRIIPCLDVDAGRVVKGVSFVNLRDAGDPVELAAFYDAQGADDLELRAVGRMKGLEIHFSESTPLAPLRSILERQGAGAGQIRFVVQTPQRGQVEVGLGERYALSPAVRAEIDALPGIMAVRDL